MMHYIFTSETLLFCLYIVSAVNSINTEFTYQENVALSGKTCYSLEEAFRKASRTNISCALSCLTSSNQCGGVFYDVETGLCIGCAPVYRLSSELDILAGTTYFNGPYIPGSDCAEIYNNGVRIDQVEEVYVQGDPVNVYCDMTTDGGGWTVFQRRFDGSVDFYRDFASYTSGFGGASGEHWLGLDTLYKMLLGKDSELYIEFVDAADSVSHVKYGTFQVSSDFRLTLGDLLEATDDISASYPTSGSAEYHTGTMFTTHDRDKDSYGSQNCGELNRGGWWYKACGRINPNGEYVTPGSQSTHHGGRGGVTNQYWRGVKSLKATKLMFRKK